MLLLAGRGLEQEEQEEQGVRKKGRQRLGMGLEVARSSRC